jgi:hypothetical protein
MSQKASVGYFPLFVDGRFLDCHLFFFALKCTENREKIAGIISVIFKTRLTNTFKYFHQPTAGSFTAICLGCKNQMDFVFDTLVPFLKNGLFALKSPGVHW